MYEVFLADHFLRQLKILLRKYPHLEENVVHSLEHFVPEAAARLGARLYKVRLKSSDIARGKSKSFRVIIYFLQSRGVVVPITIYFKGDRADISEKEIEYHLSMVLFEVRTRWEF